MIQTRATGVNRHCRRHPGISDYEHFCWCRRARCRRSRVSLPISIEACRHRWHRYYPRDTAHHDRRNRTHVDGQCQFDVACHAAAWFDTGRHARFIAWHKSSRDFAQNDHRGDSVVCRYKTIVSMVNSTIDPNGGLAARGLIRQ